MLKLFQNFFFFFFGADTMLLLELQFQGMNSTNQILEIIKTWRHD
jgi:hypothetical protein